MVDLLETGSWLHRGWLWQTTLCLLAGGAGSYLFRGRPARAHCVLLVAMFAALILPPVSHLVHRMGWGILLDPAPAAAAWHEAQVLAAPVAVATGSGADAVSPLAAGTAFPETAGARLGSVEWLGTWAATHGRSACLLGWALLSLVVLLRLLLALVAGLQLLARAERLTDAALGEAIRSAAAELGIGRQPQTYVSSGVRCPVIWGFWLRPILVLPRSAADLTATCLHGIACHELAHWKRRDHWTGLFGWLFTAALPWHPLAWWSKRRLNLLSEHVCDDWVLACGQSPANYAETLLSLCPQRRPGLVLAAVQRKGTLEGRIRRILRASRGKPLAGAVWTFVLVFLAAGLVGGIALAQRRPPTYLVERGPLAIRLLTRGTLEGEDELEVSAEVSGTVLKLISEGTLCKKGDLLVTLDATPYDLKVVEQEALVANLSAAQAIAKSTGSEAELAALAARLELERHRLDEAESRVARCRIFSPIDGAVLYHRASGRRSAGVQLQEGSLVRQRQVLLRISDVSRLQVNSGIEPQFAGAVHSGQAVRVTVDALPGRVFGGTITKVGEVPEPGGWWSGDELQHELLVSLDDPHERLRPGLTAEVEVPLLELQQVLRAPLGAVLHRGDRTLCWVRTPNGFEPREVRLGASDGEMVEVRAGLAAGDRIALAPRRARAREAQSQKAARRQELQDLDQRRQADGASSTTGGTRLTIHFERTPWSDVLAWLADQMDLSLLAPAPPEGTVRLIADEPLSLDEAFHLVNSMLRARGFTMVRRDKLMIVERLDELDPTLLPRVTPDQLDKLPDSEVVRVFFEVSEGDVAMLQHELRSQLSRWGQIVALPSSRRLDAFDSVANLRQLRELIATSRVDQPEQFQFQLYPLRYVRAEQMAAILREVLGLPQEEQAGDAVSPDEFLRALRAAAPARRGAAPSQTRIVADPRTNVVLTYANAATMATIRAIIEQLDRDPASTPPEQ